MGKLAVVVKSMSSLEIAELTGKEHRNVMSDIRKMLDELNIDAAMFSATYKAGRNNTYECFNLPKRETIVLVSGYSVAMRAVILFNGQPITITQILEKLNEASKAEEMIVELLEQRDVRDEVLGDIASLIGQEFTSSYGFNELYAELEERL